MRASITPNPKAQGERVGVRGRGATEQKLGLWKNAANAMRETEGRPLPYELSPCFPLAQPSQKTDVRKTSEMWPVGASLLEHREGCGGASEEKFAHEDLVVIPAFWWPGLGA